MKKRKLQVKVHQVNGTKGVHTLWSVKFFPKAGVNLFSLSCKLLQEDKIASDQQNIIVVNTPISDIILDHQIKTNNSWVTKVNFLCEANNERAVSATVLYKRNVYNLHIELGHLSETITKDITKALGIQVTGAFKSCKDCSLGKAKQYVISKKDVP